MNKNIIAGGIGTLIEWAEFTFYAYLIVNLSQLFFTHFSAEAALLMGFGTFAVSYLARPLGGVIFGYIGDRKGRKKALSVSILTMGVATLLMGVLPTYASMGATASMGLILLRFMQGLAVAGEFTGAAIFLAEHNHNKTYLASSWVSTFSALGMLVGAIAATLVSLENSPTWAWRVPFLVFGLLGITFGCLVRLKLTETQTFKVIVQHQQTPSLFLLLKKFKLAMLKTATLAAFVGVYIYTCNVWWLSYVIKNHYFSNTQAHMLIMFGQVLVVILTPLVALLADKLGGRFLMAFGLMGGGFAAFLLFMFSKQSDVTTIIEIQIAYAICNAAVTATMFKYLVNLFPPQIRSIGQAIGWNVAVALFGGTAPIVAQLLTDAFEATYAPALYVIAIAMVALIANNFLIFKIKQKIILSE